MSGSSRKAGLVASVLIVQGVLLYGLGLKESTPSIKPLSEIPEAIAEWRLAAETPMDARVFDYLKPDDYISRQYESTAKGMRAELFVAWFKSLNQSYGPHSPRVCLPGAGWMTREARVIPIEMPSRQRAVPVNEIFMERGDENILVLYWYQNARHAYADEVMAKVYLLPDMLRHQNADIALVRLVTTGKQGDVAVHREMRLLAQKAYAILSERFGG